MQVMCDCGRTLNPEGRCDASHALTDEQYAEMLERRRQIDLAQYRKQAMAQWFEDGSCTGSDLPEN
jgi:hypothetical protein